MTPKTKPMAHMAAYCCGRKAAVLDSRPNLGGSWRRRRKCTKCERRWTTIEIVHQAPLPGMELDVINGRLLRLQAEMAEMLEYLASIREHHHAAPHEEIAA